MNAAEALRELAEIDRELFAEPIPAGEVTELFGCYADAMWRAAVLEWEKQ